MTSAEVTSPNHDVDKLRLGQVYAKALLAVAEKEGRGEALLDELGEVVDEMFGRFPQLEMILVSPRLSPAEKLGILRRVLQGRISEPLLRFLSVVCRHDRLDCLRHIRREAQQMVDQKQQRVEVVVTTAHPLDPPLAERIRASLEAKLGRQVRLRTEVRESLIGGLVVRVGDTVFDGSIANQLARLRRQAVQRTVEQLRGKGVLAAAE